MTTGTKDPEIVKQKRLGTVGLILFIGIMNMYMPMSLDMYLPAMPTMITALNTTSSLVNVSLSCFLVFYTVGILIFGPVSDKYGRKKILCIGLMIYVVGSLGCALSFSIYQLIACRVIQAIGGGSVAAISMALIKDCFDAEHRASMMAVIQCISFAAPLMAPILGGVIIKHSSWRVIFFLLAALGALNLLLSALFTETLVPEERLKGRLITSWGRMIVVGKNPSFISLLLLLSVFYTPYMAYVAASSYIYVNFFGLNEQVYSYFFAINSVFTAVGPILYMKIGARVAPKKMIRFCFGLALVTGLCILFLGSIHPVAFLLCFLPFTLLDNGMRPLTNSILLEQQRADTGSASSLINAVNNAASSIGMMLGGMAFVNPIHGLGGIAIACTVIAMLAWFVLMRSKIQIKGLK